MSKKLKGVDAGSSLHVEFLSYFGGVIDGKCLQLSLSMNNVDLSCPKVCLTIDDALDIVEVLVAFSKNAFKDEITIKAIGGDEVVIYLVDETYLILTFKRDILSGSFYVNQIQALTFAIALLEWISDLREEI